MTHDHHLRYPQHVATDAQIRAALPHLPFSGMTAQHVERALDAAEWAREAEAPDPRTVNDAILLPPDHDWANFGTVAEIIAEHKVTRVTANTWRAKTGFPAPVATYGGVDLYDLRAVRQWREGVTTAT